MEPKKVGIDVDSKATSPSDWNGVGPLVDEILSYASSVSSDDVQQRIKLLRAARSLTLALETPMERILRHSWAEVDPFVSLSFAL
jgi:hypothetical protein